LAENALARAEARAAAARSTAMREDTIRIALVGCGGRGTGAAVQALSTKGKVELVSMADAFSDRLEGSLEEIRKQVGERVRVDVAHKFVGFDAYQRAIDSDVDLVLLATPPGFRPIHFEYAVEKGRHVFMEKPVAVDAPGVRRVLAAGKQATELGFKVGVGLQRHHQEKYLETVRRIHDGAIGKIILLRAYWNSAGVWVREREAEMTEMQYQMRNWYYFNWLCGDHIVEQHIHNLDVANWIMRGYPERAQGQGGRQVRTGADTGEIYDHHMIEFTYADGTKLFSQCRHMPDTWSSVSEHAHGSGGTADVSGGRILGTDGREWRWRGESEDPYQQEHHDLFAAVRAGKPYNETENGAKSTMTAILGRLATYSGAEITWQEALASEVSLAPATYAWDAPPPVLPDAQGRYPIAVPGSTKVL
jgi:predicted dehydrogenase